MKMVRNSDFQAKSPLSVICELNVYQDKTCFRRSTWFLYRNKIEMNFHVHQKFIHFFSPKQYQHQRVY
jgi:adenine specific DNA methylase Mod